jgi:tetratricopeptide (TPR) repeat protein
MGNLASQLWQEGSLSDGDRLWDEAYDVAGQYGQMGFARWFVGIQVDKAYALGNWDEALAKANAFIVEVEAGAPHYLAPQAYLARLLVGLGRGEHETVLADAERAIALARPAKDPQILNLALAGAAHAHCELGDPETATRLADEFMVAIDSLGGLGFSLVWAHVLSWTATEIGRGPQLAKSLATYDGVPWARAAIAFAEGRPADAAEICAEMGAVSEEAYDRLAAARMLAGEGRRAEADEQLHRALAFYRSVGATRYVRAGEALLAASA